MTGLIKNLASQNMTYTLLDNATGNVIVSANSINGWVTKDNGTQASAAGTFSVKGNGQYNYAPTQAETNATDVGFLFVATSAIPVNYDFHTDVADANGFPSVNLVDIAGTTSTGQAGSVGIDWSQIVNKTAVVDFTQTIISSVSGNVGGSVASVVGAVGSVTGAVGSVTGAVGSVTGAVGSVTGNVGGNVVGSVASVTGNVGGNVTGSVTSVLTGGLIDLTTTTYGEPSAPVGATATLKDMLIWLKTLGRNKITQTSTTETLFKDDGSTAVSTSTDSDDGTTFTRGKWS